MTRLQKSIFSAIAMAAIACVSPQALAHSKHEVSAHAQALSKTTQTELTLRDLWLDHAFWVRAVVLETLRANKAGAAAAETAAVNNAQLLAKSMEPFYGKPASEKVFALLAGHYGAVKQYLLATKAKSATDQEAARKAMFDNAEQIAVFLSTANPHLPVDTLRAMLLAHGGHHVLQIQQLDGQNYAQEAQTWEAMKGHMYGIADALTFALVKQFPAQFE